MSANEKKNKMQSSTSADYSNSAVSICCIIYIYYTFKLVVLLYYVLWSQNSCHFLRGRVGDLTKCL